MNSEDLDEANQLHNLQHISPIPMLNQEPKEEKLSEWRQLEKQMMTEAKKIRGSPKTNSGPKKAIEQPKGGANEMEQSYE